MATTIKATRVAAGISVNELARRLGVTPSAVCQLERSELEGTIKVNSLRDALGALGANLRITAGANSRMSKYAPYRVADSMAQSLLAEGDPTFALRLLTHATKELSNNFAAMDLAEIEIAPTILPTRGWDTLMRAEYARAMPKGKRPAWTRVARLQEPWFVSEFSALRERAKLTTPDYLRRLNVFIDERSLGRT